MSDAYDFSRTWTITNPITGETTEMNKEELREYMQTVRYAIELAAGRSRQHWQERGARILIPDGERS
jgi:hypothetical protein